MRKILILAVIILGIFFLATCENGISLIDEIETEVKIANDKFLIIGAISPSKSAIEINPGVSIIIEFDRGVNLDSLTTSSVVITDGINPPIEFFSYFNSSTNILTLTPLTILNSSTNYTITLNEGVKGTDDSSLNGDYAWNFGTGALPAGDVWINDPVSNDRTKYFEEPELSVNEILTLNMDYNGYTTQSRYSTSEFGTYTTWLAIEANYSSCTIPDIDGYHEVWVEFGDGDLNDPDNISTVKYDGVILDKTPGIITIESTFGDILAESNNILSLNASTTGSESGIQSYSWSADPAVGGSSSAVYTNSPLEDTSVTVTGQNTTTFGLTTIDLTLTGTDNLGRSFSDIITVSIDTVIPGTPIVSGTSPTLDFTPTWTWSTGNGGGAGYQYQLDSTSGTWTSTASTVRSATTLSTGNHTLYVRESDSAGNWSSIGSKVIQIVVPTVYGSTYTLDTTPTWTWGSTADGTGNYSFNLDGGAWSNSVTSTSYTSGTLSDGLHTLYLQEFYGTWSNSGYKTTRVTPLIPYDGQTKVPTTSTFYWRGTILKGTTYTIESYNTLTKKYSEWFGPFYSPTDSYPFPYRSLLGRTSYHWRLKIVGLKTTYIPSTGYYTFTTY